MDVTYKCIVSFWSDVHTKPCDKIPVLGVGGGVNIFKLEKTVAWGVGWEFNYYCLWCCFFSFDHLHVTWQWFVYISTTVESMIIYVTLTVMCIHFQVLWNTWPCLRGVLQHLQEMVLQWTWQHIREVSASSAAPHTHPTHHLLTNIVTFICALSWPDGMALLPRRWTTASWKRGVTMWMTCP